MNYFLQLAGVELELGQIEGQEALGGHAVEQPVYLCF